MIQISEWLPNPAGRDAPQNEWVELYNSGGAAVNLSGWKLRTANGKTGALSGVIQPGEYKVFTGAVTGLRLRNTDEKLTLINPAGQTMDESSYIGQAADGQSVNHEGQISFWAAPTPGAANVSRASAIIDEPHPYATVLNPGPGLTGFLAAMLSLGVALACATLYVLKQSDDLSELFFGGN